MTLLALIVGAAVTAGGSQAAAAPAVAAPLRFEVRIGQGVVRKSQAGRLFVVVSRRDQPEPRLGIGGTGKDASPVFARDVRGVTDAVPGVIDHTAISFPIDSMSALPPGDYFVQAVLDTNLDLRSVNAPGNLYSAVAKVSLDPARTGTISLTLTGVVAPEQLPPDTEFVKYLKLPSTLLSDFHKRPIYLRAGIILPRDYGKDPARRFPVRVRIGGYGARFTGVGRMMAPASEFRKVWEAADSPSFIVIHLDGDGPLGDPYQVNSDNHGPFGDAITQELIPYVERTYNGIGQGSARVVDGGSTGGWVSFALQVFYPEYFSGAWSYCPDGVDFRGFQLVNIYDDANAYVNQRGFERPAARDVNGDVRMTMRHEVGLENVLGAGDNWAMSGQQWGAWNATYGPRGPDGRPVPLWDPRSGAIDRSVLDHWKRYDLRLILEQNWAVLAPKLKSKIHVWIGDADNFFLNNAVHMLDAFLSKAMPPYEGSITYGPGMGHCWVGLTERQIVDQMGATVAAGAPRRP